jgi:hypothetical protein
MAIAVRFGIEVAHRPRRDNRGYGVFIYELSGLTHGIEQNGKGVEPSHHSPKLNSSDQVDGDADILLAHLVQENVLKVELAFRHRDGPPKSWLQKKEKQ